MMHALGWYAQRKVSEQFEYLGKMETELKNMRACLSWAQMGSNHEQSLCGKPRDPVSLHVNRAYISATLWAFDDPVYSKMSPKLFYFMGI